MQEQLRNKLINSEIAPPPAVWSTISRRLDEEFNPFDSGIASRLYNAVILPPPDLFASISTTLDSSSENERPARVVPLLYKRIAIAAALLSVFSLVAFYMLNDRVSTTNTTATTEGSSSLPTIIERERSARPAPLTEISPRSSSSNNQVLLADNRAPQTKIRKLTFKPVRKVAAVAPVSVDAPLIKDAEGNVILDHSLIKNPGDQYITVTSPNGSPTKISSKFINCLSYLHGTAGAAADYEEKQWKSRFEEWRSKLLDDAGFIPAATNFFDIFELQEMIRE